MSRIPIEIYDKFFEDFFFNFSTSRTNIMVNKSIHFISDNIDPLKTSATSVKAFLYDLFLSIFNENLNNYQMEYLIIEKDISISLFKKEHHIMPECFITVLEECSRDKTYEKVKYTLINFMYSIIND